MKIFPPDLSCCWFNISNDFLVITTSPRTSKFAGSLVFFNTPVSTRSGIDRIVFTFGVTSSPVVPSPRVAHRGKSLARCPTHPHRRRIRGQQLWIRSLQLFQPVHQPVIRGIRNLRIIEHVIPVFVVAQLLAKLFYLFFHTCWRSLGHETLGRSLCGNSTGII